MDARHPLTFNGRLVDKTSGRGSGVCQIQVFAWLRAEGRQGPYLRTAQSDNDGRFDLTFTAADIQRVREFGADEIHLTVFKASDAIASVTTTLDRKRTTSTLLVKTESADAKRSNDITIEDAWVDLGSGAGASAGAAGAGQPLSKVVSDALGTVVGARWNPSDPPQRQWELLDRAFSAQKVDGRTTYMWNRAYSVTAATTDGPLTGDQAILADLANTTRPQMLSLLQGLKPAIPSKFDAIEGEATRSIMGTLLTEMTAELNRVPPRMPKVETLVKSIQEQLKRLERVFGFLRYSITLGQAEGRTDFDKLRLLVTQLTEATKTFLERAAVPEDFGTQLILLRRVLAAVTETVEDTRKALESVLISQAEQVNIYLGRSSTTPGVSVAGILDWAASLETYARTLIEEGGMRGVEVLVPTVEALKGLVDLLLNPRDGTADQYPAIRRPRVQRPLGELDSNLEEVLDRLRALMDAEKKSAEAESTGTSGGR
jgi:hypothetical protein